MENQKTGDKTAHEVRPVKRRSNETGYTYGIDMPRVRRQALGKTEELLLEEADRENRRLTEQGWTQDTSSMRKQYRKRKKHRLFWGMIAAFCLIMLGMLFVFLAPQLLGVRWNILPNFAFTGEGMIQYDQATVQNYSDMRDRTLTQRLLPGITIDGVDVGGMTLQEARTALESVDATGGGGFSVMVRLGDVNYVVDDSMVPLERNTERVLHTAYSIGRKNTLLRGSGMTPVLERYRMMEDIREHPVALQTSLSYDREKVREITDRIADSVIIAPVSAQVASFDMQSKTFSFTDDVNGKTLDKEELYQAVMQSIDQGEQNAMVVMEPEEVIAPVTKAELMNSFGKISTYSTSTTSNANRNTNIQLSAEAINGMVVDPGMTFSFNMATGQRTAEKGYREATAISGGQNIPEVGGGVCQTSSTLFNAVARADLEIVTRSPHAWPSSYVEKGMDATVNWPGLDFQFRNNTEWPIYIVAVYKNRRITVDIYGHNLQEGITIDLESKVIRTIPAPSGIKEVENETLPKGTRKTTVKARKGYEVETYKVYYQAGKEVHRELLCKSTYKAYQETVEFH